MNGKVNNDDFLINRIYEEMKQVSTNVYYADELLDRQIVNSKIFNICVALFSSGGAALFYVDTLLPVVTSIIVAIAAIINQFHPVFFLKTEDLSKLLGLRTDYNVYLNKLQNIFDDAFFSRTSYEDTKIAFTNLHESNASKVTEISRLFGKINSKMNKKAADKSDKYLNSIYNGK